MVSRPTLYDDPRRNERELPCIVELVVPPSETIDVIGAWHRTRFLEQHRGRGRYQEPHWYRRWCFKEPRDAQDFMAAFGGVLVPPLSKARRRSRA